MFRVNIIIIVFLSVNCNSNNQVNTNNIADSNTTISKRISHSYSIEKFLGFDNRSSIDAVLKYFRKNNIQYVINPDFQKTFTYNDRENFNSPGALGLEFYPQCVFVPELPIGDIRIKKTFFGFFKDSLCFVVAGGLRIFDDGSIFKLKEYYERKYGEGNFLDFSEDINWPYKVWWYDNDKKGVHVSFKRNITLNDHCDEFTITFSNINSLNKYLEKETRKEMDSLQLIKNKKDKKILDNL
jgi:uncharacterized protein YcfL